MTFLRLSSMEVSAEWGSLQPAMCASPRRWESSHRLSLSVGCWLMACGLVGGWSWCSRAWNATHCIAPFSSCSMKWLVVTLEPRYVRDSNCPLTHRRATTRVVLGVNRNLEWKRFELAKNEFIYWINKLTGNLRFRFDSWCRAGLRGK